MTPDKDDSDHDAVPAARPAGDTPAGAPPAGAAPGGDPDAPAGPLPTDVRRVLGVASVVLAAGLAVLTPVVASRPPGAWELEAVHTATDVTDVVGWPARVVMQLGTFGAVVSFALVTAYFLRQRLAPVAVLAGGLVSLAVANRLKAVVERERPEGVRLREAQDGFGYPSSHAAVAFGLAVVLTALVPRRWRWAPLSAALVVALARMHVGVHYPLDVVGGALVGGAVGLATVALLDPAHR